MLNGIDKENVKKYATYSLVKAGVAIFLQPLARIMVFQQNTGAHFMGSLHAILKEGYQGLFKGTTSSMTREGLKASYKGCVMIKAQDYSKKVLPETSKLQSLARGALTGFLVSIIDPCFIIDRYRIYKMTRDPRENTNFIQFLKQLHHHSVSGSSSTFLRPLSFFRELFRGFGVSLFKQMSTSMHFFVAREMMDKMASDKNESPYAQQIKTVFFPALAATIGGLPFDVLQTRMQAKIGETSALTLFNTLRQKGLRGFTAGLWPKCGLTLVSYSVNAEFLNYFKQSKTLEDNQEEFNNHQGTQKKIKFQSQ